MKSKTSPNEINPMLTLRHGPVLRTAAAITLIAFVSLYMQPVAMAARVANKRTFGFEHKRRLSAEHELATTVDKIQVRLKSMDERLEKGEDATQDRDDLNTLRADLDRQNKAALADFAAIGKRLREKHLPAVILQRQAAMVKKYKQHIRTLRANLEAIEKAKNDSDRQALTQKAWQDLKAVNKKRPRPKFDPKNLPNKSLRPNRKNKPRQYRKDFLQAGLSSNPRVQLAALGDFTFDKLPDASNPAYLAATPEVVLTPAIKAKAKALNYDPVTIYNWVRNNVQWIPTWGASQDADMTLGSLRGNAMDISSLLIALYRASGIPARYVQGTIELPADKFMNWAGGFTSIEAAMDYASSGGVPVTGIVSGGQVTMVQMEHIWVEAAIDFHPSRGAVNKSADTWVPLDPSYKQYKYLKGLDVASISGIDPKTLAQSFTNSGTVNTAEGWVQNLDPVVIQNAVSQAQSTIEQYVSSNMPNATYGDVLGGRIIVARNMGILPTGLPYDPGIVVRGATYGTLPAADENSMTLGFGTDILGDPINPVTLPWPELNNHKVTLSFVPATSADQQTLNSLLPTGSITDQSMLPSSIPAYLINVIPQLAVDGRVVGRGQSMQLGSDMMFYYRIQSVGGGASDTYTHAITAGSYLDVGVAGGSVSPLALTELQNRVAQTASTLQSQDVSSISALTQEDMLGDLYYVGALAYFSQDFVLTAMNSDHNSARHGVRLAYGTFGYEPNVQYFFGLPQSITPGGVSLDVRLSTVTEPLNGDLSNIVPVSLQSGLLSSALEHIVPEEMFSRPSAPLSGVSAVKLLTTASQQGQKIYLITSANQAQVLPLLHLSSASMAAISAGLAAGQRVITQTDPVTINGWTGEGYIVFDPVTGSGAYMISGGANGGWLSLLRDFFLFVTAAALGFVDSTAGKYADQVFMFADDLKYLATLAKISQVLGFIGLALSIYFIWTDKKLNVSQKIGQTAMALLGFAITAVVVAGLAFFGGGLIAGLIGIAVAFVIAIAVADIDAMYFSLLWQEDRPRMLVAYNDKVVHTDREPDRIDVGELLQQA